MWKETECNGSAPYHGEGARAGLILDIREIKNGFVITTAPKYTDNIDDGDPIEQYIKDKTELNDRLKLILEEQIADLCKKVDNSTEFTDEVDPVKHEKRVETVKRGTTDVNELLKRMAKAKAKAEVPSTEED